MATVGELIKVDYKKDSLTLEELQAALIAAQGIQAISKVPEINAALTAALIAVTAYNTIITVVDIIQKATPAVKAATKAAAIPLNPSMAAEVAQDGIQLAIAQVPGLLATGVQTAKDAVLGIEVPGT